MELSITIIFIIITAIVSFVYFSNLNLLVEFIFYQPAVRGGEFYRFFCCGLILADWGRLMFYLIGL